MDEKTEARNLKASRMLQDVLKSERDRALERMLRAGDQDLPARRAAVLTIDNLAETLHARIKRALGDEGAHN